MLHNVGLCGFVRRGVWLFNCGVGLWGGMCVRWGVCEVGLWDGMCVCEVGLWGGMCVR